MEKHPIENLMTTTLESLRDMVDVNTVVGEAISTPDGATVIPISRVSFGFVAGGGEYGESQPRQQSPQTTDADIPFAGGGGAGVTVQPVGFLVVQDGSVRMLPASCSTVADRMVDLIPTVIDDVKNLIAKPDPQGMM